MLTVAERFKTAIRDYMRTPEYSSGNRKIRARVFTEDIEPELSRLRLLELAETVFRSEERAEVRAPENVYQMFLPGFSSLDEKLPVKSGKVPLAKATVTTLEESLAIIRKKVSKHPDITRIEALLEGMRPFAKENPGLVVERYCELRAAGVEAGVKAKAGKG